MTEPSGGTGSQRLFSGRVFPLSLRSRLVLPFVLLIAAVLLVLTLVFSVRVHDIYVERLSKEMRIEAETIAGIYLVAREQSGGSVGLGGIVAELPERNDRRITLIDGNGDVLADTAFDNPDSLENHADREEVREAASGDTGMATRTSASTGNPFLYVAIPLDDGSQSVLRIAVPLDDVEAVVDRMQRYLAVTAGIVLVLAVGVAVVMGRRLAEPLEHLRMHAQRVASGDLSTEVAPISTREIDAVGQAFNSMTGQLRRSLEDLDRTSTRLEAVLAGLDDGVVLTDVQGDVLRMNGAAERMLAAQEGKTRGRPFIQAARDHELDALLQAALSGHERRPEAIEHGLNRRILLSSASRVAGRSEFLGLVVLRDITELRRLESVRREFVANVSHELRTPLTSIRAIVETIESGAVEDPAMTQEFMQRIVGEIDRLTALVEDLLDLARLEAGRAPLNLERATTDDLIRKAGERLRPQIERAGLMLIHELPEGLPDVLVDRRQIEQVVVNLVHNAIKFTPADGTITLSARGRNGQVIGTVSDTGIGIAEAELPRLFERFYKSDKARRSEGTGLGLAIAKHIMQAHGGDVEVASRPGKGSVFSFSMLMVDSEDAAELASRNAGSRRTIGSADHPHGIHN